ncbi:unnamed protein product [Cyclocybe aegerita]|uniref:DUF6593 domain-containing protein n=1 Tax=Cyclocybe aegerita TaxID=1973307 RepID=A0A8S0W9E9_CYCAE|nr:unnamed protein product [Cyclocybe aegerita]
MLTGPESADMQLIFTKPSVTNVTLLFKGQPYYEVSTTDSSAPTTKVTSFLTNEPLITICRHRFQSDTIKFAYHHDARPLKIKKWLKEGNPTSGRLTWTISTSMGMFVWRTDTDPRLVLCPENDTGRPIAWIQVASEGAQLAIVMKREVEGIKDEIIASVLILERDTEMKEKRIGVSVQAAARTNPLAFAMIF